MAEKVEISGKLLPGSYKGVPIYFERASLEGGRKTTSRPIVNSDLQRISDVGEKQPTYTLQGYVSARYKAKDEQGSPIDEDYTTFRKRLLATLRSPGAGVLVHPFEGEIDGLVCTSFSLNETITRAGMADLSMTLEVDKSQAIALIGIPGEDDVDGAASDVEASFAERLTESLGIDPATLNAFSEGLAKVQDVYEGVQAAAETVENVAAAITGFAQDINQLVEDASSILLTPARVVQSIENVFTAVQNVFPTFEARFDAMVDGFDFGDDDDGFDITTAGGAQKQDYQDAVNAGTQAFFLTNAVRAVTGLDLETVEELEAVEQKIDAQHEKLVANPAVPPEVVDRLQTLRERLNAFLAARRITALRQSVADIAPGTPRTLSYALYESDEKAVTLARLNGVESYALLRGRATVLSS